MRVVVTGGTGFVGRSLCAALLEHGHAVTVLTRTPSDARAALPSSVDVAPWDPEHGNATLPEGTEAVVNLAGESIASGRWNAEQKRRIMESRVKGTEAIVNAIAAATPRPTVLINASAIGVYGSRGDEPLAEDATAGTGFLSEVVQAWEEAARKAEPLGVRLVMLRIGVILGRDGGALGQMALPFKLFAGGPVGSGRQWMSWIHLDDVVGMIVWALEDTAVSGPINTVAPEPLRNADFNRELGRALGRPSWLPAPAFALKLILGEMADTLLLNGQRVIPARALELGYVFKHPSARTALEASV